MSRMIILIRLDRRGKFRRNAVEIFFKQNQQWYHPVGASFMTPCLPLAPLSGRHE